jgi:hypothetical protein
MVNQDHSPRFTLAPTAKSRPLGPARFRAGPRAVLLLLVNHLLTVKLPADLYGQAASVVSTNVCTSMAPDT